MHISPILLIPIIALGFVSADAGAIENRSPSPVSYSAQATVYSGAIRNPDDPQLATFSQMMQLAFPNKDLKRFFDGTSHTTIFAPTNRAFAALMESMTEQQRASLLDPDTGFLERVLRYHFTEGDWRLSPPPFGLQTPDTIGGLRMADGNVGNVFREGPDLHIECAGIDERLIFANGVVHLIDKVVMPPDVPRKLRCSPPR